MFGKSVRLFRLFGFEVKVDLSWLIVAVLIVWSLASGLFPVYYRGISVTTYYWMGVFGAVGLFASIVIHEFAHSLVARRFGIPMRGITLFIFGGVAEMHDEPQSARAELFMAAAGPLTSIAIGILFFLVYLAGRGDLWTRPVAGVLLYLGFINLILAGFNLLPAFPLDGGRILRSILWSWKDNIRWATRISSRIGSGFGIALIVLGAANFIFGNFIGGIWWFLIGLFLRNVAQGSYQQLLLRKSLEGEPVEKFMKTSPVSVPPDVRLDKFVEDYVYKYHFKTFPVVDDSRLVSCVNIRQLKDIPRADWNQRTVGEIAVGCSNDNTISTRADAMQALSTMRRTGNSRLMVVENGKLVGIIALKDMLDFLSLKIDLEGQ